MALVMAGCKHDPMDKAQGRKPEDFPELAMGRL